MTLNSEDTHSEYLRDLHDDGGGGLASSSVVEGRVSDDMAQLGTVYTSEASIPSSATVRESGVFTDAYAAMQYLMNGGLHATENNGDLVPIGFVYLLEYFDELLQDYAYRVYIDEDTG